MCEDGWFTGNDANLYYRAGLDTVEHSQVFIFSRKDRPGANLSSPFFVGPQRRTTTPSQNEKDHAVNLASQFQSPEAVTRRKVNVKDAISYNQKARFHKCNYCDNCASQSYEVVKQHVRDTHDVDFEDEHDISEDIQLINLC